MNAIEIKRALQELLCLTEDDVHVMEARGLFNCYAVLPDARTYAFQISALDADTQKRVVDGFRRFAGAKVTFDGTIKVEYRGKTHVWHDIDEPVKDLLRAHYTKFLDKWHD